jgi:16S rRNA (cytidine1402-2'-O)-methyltransferase
MERKQGKLYVVATPIGNLGDTTQRAAEVLAKVDLVAAEDTRRTRILLAHLGLARPMVSYRSRNWRAQGESLLKLLAQGKEVALVTDAGTPCISDPGFILVRQAAAAGIEVVAVPGVSSLTAALSVSGFPAERFVFEGFLPQKKGRQKRLRELAAEPRTVVLFESPHRIRATLDALAGLCPGRPIVITRELTKLYEEIIRGTIIEVQARLSGVKPRGEYVIVLGPLEKGLREDADAAHPREDE